MKHVLMVFLLTACFTGFAQTNISGDISGTWTTANSPYLIVGNVTIQQGSLLTIEPGVEIRFTGRYTFYVYGTLKANGAANDSILFTRNAATEASRGKGIRFVSSYTDTSELSYCIIEYGNASSGGGIYVSNSNVLIDRCTIRNNKATLNGGGLTLYQYYNRFLIIRNCRIENNTVGGGNSSFSGGGGICAGGGGNSSTVAMISNNLLINNVDDRNSAPNSEGGGGILLSGGDFPVFNNTIYGNSSPKGCGILTRDDYEGEIVNNIVWGNVGSGNDEQIAIETGWYPGGTIPANLNISYNCIQEEGIVVVYRNTMNNIEYTSGINNFQQNPLFINTTESNFHLLNNSPCINTGNPATDTTLFSVDMDSNIRIYNDTIDIGAYEYQFTADSLVANFYTNHTEGDTSSTIKFTDLSIGIPTNWSWDFNSDGTIDSYERNPEYVFNSPGTYSVTLTCEDSTQQSTKTKTSYITIYPKEDWSEFFADTIPHKRWYHKMAYCGNGHVLLFGGNWESGWDWSYDNRTWIYNVNDSTWTNMHTPNPPSGRSLHSMAYLGGDMVLLYGGNNGSNETWIYDYSDNSWTNKTSSITPLTTYGADMSYLDHGKILLFGGYGGLNQNGRNDETVIYDLSTNTWEKQTPLNNVKPVAREGYGMAYMGNGQVLLFAGELWNYQRNNETWIYSYTDNSWTQKFPTVSPSARSYFGMASIGNKKALVFSGGGGSDETWVYSLDSNQWSQRTYQHFKPSARYGVDISETSMNGSSNPILFAGNSNNQPLKDCWIFDSGDSISPELTVSFIGYNHEGVYPRFVQFEDLSFDYVTSWQWDFDNDGTFDSYIQKPSYTYNTPGKYSVKLVVSDGTNYDTLIRTDYINVVNLIPRFVTDTTMMYVGESIQFTDSTIGVPTSWQWDFGDGATSTEQNPTHSYLNTGNYSVSLTVGDAYGDTTLVKTNLIHIFPSNHVWGTISENTNWCLDTIFVAGNVFLANSKTLTICPGTVIMFQGHFKINIQGTLIAEGTVNDSITFIAEDTFTGWHGLRFNDTPATNDSSIINYCNFRYGKAINDSTNSYGSGGAIYVYKYDKIRIENSHFTYNNSAVDGGCIYLREADIKIINSLFDYNTAREAGAIMVSESAALLDRLILVNNVVDAEWYSSGGALYFGGYQSNAVVSNCLISNNTATKSAGGVYMWACSPLLINNTIVNNKVTNSYSYGGAIFSNGATPTIKNSIIWGNEASSYSQIRGNISSMEYTDIQGGGFPGTGNIDSDPKFMTPVNGAGNQYSGSANGWKLRYGSPCINRGDPLTDTSVYKKDLSGKKRIQMQFIDIGCYENGLQWTGESGSEWNNSGNWFEGNVPTDSSNVTITNYAINSPVISSDVTINSLWMEDSAVLTVSPPSILTITQNFLTTNQQPNQPNSPVPINGSIGQYINTSLSWSCSDPEGDILTYDIYFGTVATPPLVATAQSDTIYNPGTLVDSTTYYWKIIAHDNYGNITEGNIWQFTCISNQPPTQPASPIPADSAQNQSLTVDLHWSCSDPEGDSLTYDVYLSTDSIPVLVASAITDTTYDPGTLNYDSTYFWKIVAHDNHNNTKAGDIWVFSTESQSTTNPYTLNDSLVGYWSFDDGTATDNSGNGHNGSIHGTVPFTDWENGKYITFDGNYNNYVQVPHSTDLNFSGSFSICAWINKLGSGTGSAHVISKGRDMLSDYYLYAGGRAFSFRYYDTWGAPNSAVNVDDSIFTLNEWHYVACVVDTTNMMTNYYLNGVLMDQDTIDQFFNITTTWPLVFGRHFTNATGGSSWPYPSNVSLDEVRIYNRALSVSEILELGGFTSQNTLNDSLVAYYPFNGNANDESGNSNNGSVNGATLTTDRFGNDSSAYLFDGNDFIDCGNSSSLNWQNSDFSVSAWVKRSSQGIQSATHQVFVGKQLDGGDYRGWFFRFNPDDSFSFETNYNSSWAGNGRTSSTYDVTDTTWHHYCGVLDGQNSLIKLYVDGVLNNSNAGSNNYDIDNISDLFIGRKSNGEYYYGKIDDIRIYNRAISLAEVNLLYHENGWGNITANFTSSDTTITLGDTIQFTDLSTGNPTSWLWDFGDGTSDTVQNPSHIYQTTGTYSVLLVVFDGTTSDTLSKVDYINVESNINYFINETQNLNNNLVPSDWGLYIQNQVAGLFNGRFEAHPVDAQADLKREGIMPSNIEMLTLDWDGVVDTSYWGQFTGVKIYWNGNYFSCSSGNASYNFNGDYTSIRYYDSISNTSSVLTDLYDSYSYEENLFSVSITNDSIFYTANSISNGNEIFSISMAIADSINFQIDSVDLIAYNVYTTTGSISWLDNIEISLTESASQLSANFTASDTTITLGDTVQFTDLSTGNPTSWLWDFGDGTSDTVQNPSHIYQTTGTYSVSLVVSDSTNSDTLSKVDYINVENPNQPPAQPTSPIPADSSQNQSTTVNLHWSCFDPDGDSLTYDVYFSTDTIPVLVASAITDTTYDPGTLNYDSTYFWKIVAHDNHNNITVGDVWQFTTETQTTSWQCGDTLIDSRDGQLYATVQIGTQCWMAENLNIGTRIDGSSNQTNNGTIEKYCYDDNTSNCDTYGGLYQWDEMMQYVTTEGAQGICPTGWHVPTDAEWCILENEVDAGTINCGTTGFRGTNVGGNLKETDTIHWADPNTGATNSSGFTALPGGYRNLDGTYGVITTHNLLWSSTETTSDAWERTMVNTYTQVSRWHYGKTSALSVRCVRD